ncbi:lysylphosphatidylglycerol synthase domain-containing protein [Beggiatoa leptomitoformis]|uniref:Flippase-like domain-containing protein n=1 Tax=Beggiatoa leptomitoformis TaxID=288004 RepID=A0A2N9YAT4_9GAMM|nr:lysylphosphatidylglycerol synthase domain-containing protein [Beggiatoa leptomitoformis]ALG67065.1 hypothetical protein AL038_04215 [Beggiatoa leptomitoformis]AUI67549.1 hypothetical protein BLE401_01790 [Beggiatoa leptomitoformis]
MKHLRPVLFIFGLCFLMILLWHSWEKIKGLLITVQWTLFSLSVLITMAWYIVTSLLFKELLQKYGVIINHRLNHTIFFYGQIAKYVPGKVFGLLYQSLLLQTKGATSAVVFANLDLMGLLIFCCSAIALTLTIAIYNLFFAILLFLLSLLICVWITRTCLFFTLTKHILFYFQSIAKRLTLCSCVPHSSNIKVMSYYILFWFSYLGGHYFLLQAVFDFSLTQSTYYIICLSAGWVVGAVSLIIPAGMGVKELVFVYLAHLITQDVTLDTLTAVAVVSRVWLMLQELLGITWVFCWNFYHHRFVPHV